MLNVLLACLGFSLVDFERRPVIAENECFDVLEVLSPSKFVSQGIYSDSPITYVGS